MRFPVLAARLALAALVPAAVIAAVAVIAVRTGMASFTIGLEVMTASVALAVIALLLSTIWMVFALRNNRGDAKRAGMAAFFGALALLYVPLHTVYQGLMAPPIHDATTDPEDPPLFVALAKQQPPGERPFDPSRKIHYRGEYNTVSYMLHTYYRELTKPLMPILPCSPKPGVTCPQPASKMFWRAFNVAKRKGWHIVDFSEKDGRIEVTATSFWFGQPSDIVVRVRPAGTNGARFDVRVASEKGAPDFGRSLELIKLYRVELGS